MPLNAGPCELCFSARFTNSFIRMAAGWVVSDDGRRLGRPVPRCDSFACFCRIIEMDFPFFFGPPPLRSLYSGAVFFRFSVCILSIIIRLYWNGMEQGNALVAQKSIRVSAITFPLPSLGKMGVFIYISIWRMTSIRAITPHDGIEFSMTMAMPFDALCEM